MKQKLHRIGWFTLTLILILLLTPVSAALADDEVPPATFTVTFEPLGGTMSYRSIEVTAGQAIGTLPVPKLSGCTFIGWFTDAMTYLPTNEITRYSTIQNDAKVYAKWQYNDITLSSPIGGGMYITYNPSGYSSYSWDVRGGTTGSISTSYDNAGYRTFVRNSPSGIRNQVTNFPKDTTSSIFCLVPGYTDLYIARHLEFSTRNLVNGVKITYYLYNAGAAKTVDLGCCVDVEINGQDEAEVKFLDDTKTFTMTGNSKTYALDTDGTSAQWADEWYSTYYDHVFDRLDSNKLFVPSGTDSALAFSWWNIALNPNELWSESIFMRVYTDSSSITLPTVENVTATYSTADSKFTISGTVNINTGGACEVYAILCDENGNIVSNASPYLVKSLGTVAANSQQAFSATPYISDFPGAEMGHNYTFKIYATIQGNAGSTKAVPIYYDTTPRNFITVYGVTFELGRVPSGAPQYIEPQLVVEGSHVLEFDVSTNYDVEWFKSTDFTDGNKWDFKTDTVDRNLTLYAKWDTLTQANKPDAKIDYVTEKLTGLIPNGTYFFGKDNTPRTADNNGYYPIDSTWLNSNLSIIKCGISKESSDSEPQSLYIPVRPDAPRNMSILYSSTTATVSGVTAAMQYKLSTGSVWIDGTGDIIELPIPTASASYLVRVKANQSEQKFLSKEATLTLQRVGTPSISINYVEETLTGFSATTSASYNISIDNGVGTVSHTGSSARKIEETWFGKKATIIRKGVSGVNADSLSKIVSIPARGAAPLGLSVSYDENNTLVIDGTDITMQYKKSTDTTWNDCTAVRTTPDAFDESVYYCVRYKAASDKFASNEAILSKPLLEPTPAATIDYVSEHLTSLTDGSYLFNGVSATVTDGVYAINSSWMNDSNLSIVKCSTNGDTLNSAPQLIRIPSRPSVPTNLSAIAETLQGAGDATISGTTAAMQRSNDEGATWVACLDGTTTGLSSGTYLIRVAAVAKTDSVPGNFASETTTIVIPEATEKRTYQLTVTAPTFTDVTIDYQRPDPQAIIIENKGNSGATISTVSLSSDTAFELTSGGNTVPVNSSIDTWKVQPKENLSVQTHTATITVTYNDGKMATADVSFTVNNPAPINYNVTFAVGSDAPNGIQNEMQEVESGKCASVPQTLADAAQQNGFELSWYADADLTTLWNFETSITANITIYAKWTPPNAQTPTIAINYISEKLTDFVSGATYNLSIPDIYAGTHLGGTDLSIATEWFGQTIAIIREGVSGSSADSLLQSLLIPARPDAPEKLTPVAETFRGEADGQITETTTAMEYSGDDGTTWHSCSDGSTGPLSAGDYLVRIRAVDGVGGNFRSTDAAVTVDAGTLQHTYKLTLKVPSFDSVTVGYGHPAAQSIIITNEGNSDATISDVSLSAGTAFDLIGNGSTVSVNSSIDTWKIQPKADLSAGTYIDTITVFYNNSNRATATVSFIVSNPYVPPTDPTTSPTDPTTSPTDPTAPPDDPGGDGSDKTSPIPEDVKPEEPFGTGGTADPSSGGSGTPGETTNPIGSDGLSGVVPIKNYTPGGNMTVDGILTDSGGMEKIRIPSIPITTSAARAKARAVESITASVRLVLTSEQLDQLTAGTYYLWIESAGDQFNYPMERTPIGTLVISDSWSMPKTLRATDGFTYQLVSFKDPTNKPAMTINKTNSPAVNITDDGTLTATLQRTPDDNTVQITCTDQSGFSRTCTVTVVPNRYARSSPLRLAGKYGVFSSMKSISYNGKNLEIEIYLLNKRKNKRVYKAGHLTLAIYRDSTVIYTKKLTTWRMTKSLKYNGRAIYKITLTPEDLKGAPVGPYDLVDGHYQAVLKRPTNVTSILGTEKKIVVQKELATQEMIIKETPGLPAPDIEY